VIARWLDSRKRNSARAAAEAAAEEQQRQQAVHRAEQQRQQAIQYAERQRLRAEQEREMKERWTYLCSRYGEDDARKIWDRRLWVGCTTEMLFEMLGVPPAMDERVLKTKTKRTYKYRPAGINRYALRVFVEDDVVTGWADKSGD
jgi:hypothetical protein